MAPDKKTSDRGIVIDPAAPAPSQPHTPVIAQRAPFIGWLAKHVILPLTPFLVGSLIRLIRLGHFSPLIFEASELAFSFAMFCLIGVVAARRIENPQYREAAFTFFVIGVALFISLFSFAVAEDTRLEILHADALRGARETLLTAGAPLDAARVDIVLRQKDESEVVATQRVILLAISSLGIVFLLVGFVMRDRYALGEDA